MDEKVLEMVRRRKNVEAVMANFRLEGMEFSPEEKAEYERYISGEITLEDIRNNFLATLAKRKSEHPERYTEDGPT
jgi:hypothetical protein